VNHAAVARESNGVLRVVRGDIEAAGLVGRSSVIVWKKQDDGKTGRTGSGFQDSHEIVALFFYYSAVHEVMDAKFRQKKPPEFSGGFCGSIGNRNSEIANQ
jgi:hypothetical protein